MSLLTLAQDTAAATAEGNALAWGFVLLVVAVALLIVELFVPSGGLIAVVSALCAIGSLVAFYRYDTTWGFAATLGYLILGPVAGYGLYRLWLYSPIANRLILGGTTPDDGSDEAGRASEVARRQRLEELRALVGAEGVAETHLRPVGTVRIGGESVDCVAELGVITPGTPVVVTDVHDNQIKVRPR